MKKYIDVTREVRQDIMAAFNVTGKMVYYALNFDAKRGESDKAKRIRVYAKQKGGIVMIVAPERALKKVPNFKLHSLFLNFNSCPRSISSFKSGILFGTGT